ncbi:MAG: preprotein translocase subunit SecA [Pirellulaceae bacterium]
MGNSSSSNLTTQMRAREMAITPSASAAVTDAVTGPQTPAMPSPAAASALRCRPARWLSAIRGSTQRFASLNEAELRQMSAALRARVAAVGPDLPAVQIEAFALMYEAVRRVRAVELYDVQLVAALILATGQVAEMQTGEGKTLACAPAAYLHGLTGRGVHIATPNVYLAHRDCELLSPAFQLLGVSAGLLPEREARDRKRAAYLCDVTYGTAYEFGFDYLRDQLSLRQMAHRPLGRTLWRRILDDGARLPETIQRPLSCVIVDEIDNVLLDDAGSPLVLSGAVDAEASDATAHQLAHCLAACLVPDQHYRYDPSIGSVRLTDAGMDHIHANEVVVPVSVLLRTWTEYVEKALLARHVFRRDVHYIVRDGAIQIVDASTGRIYSDRTWQDGLHQAIEAKEGLRITSERHPLAQITRQRYFRLYQRLSGMTGTAVGCEREFRQVYGLRTRSVPLRAPCRRQILPARFFASSRAKWQAVTESAVALHAVGRPVLIGTRSIDDSEFLAAMFSRQTLQFELLNGRQDATEAAVVAGAGKTGAITIATNLAGRGTDIRLSPEVVARGGLHVIIAECHDSARVDRQLIGRCARQGDPGSAQTFVSAEDSLIQRFGPWLAQSMQRHAGSSDELAHDLSGQVRRLQALAERRDYASRCGLLRRDQSRDALFCERPARM